MKRPGPVGITILVAFGIVAAIELRTLLGMVGIEVTTQLYYGGAAAVIILGLIALSTLPKKEAGNPSNA